MVKTSSNAEEDDPATCIGLAVLDGVVNGDTSAENGGSSIGGEVLWDRGDLVDIGDDVFGEGIIDSVAARHRACTERSLRMSWRVSSGNNNGMRICTFFRTLSSVLAAHINDSRLTNSNCACETLVDALILTTCPNTNKTCTTVANCSDMARLTACPVIAHIEDTMIRHCDGF